MLFEDWTTWCGSVILNVQLVLGKTRCSYKIIIQTGVRLKLILFQFSGALLNSANTWKSKRLNITVGMPFLYFQESHTEGPVFLRGHRIWCCSSLLLRRGLSQNVWFTRGIPATRSQPHRPRDGRKVGPRGNFSWSCFGRLWRHAPLDCARLSHPLNT